jgi:Domain of unknown function (DUF6471)
LIKVRRCLGIALIAVLRRKAKLKRADVTYKELAKRLKEQGLAGETVDPIKAKLRRRTFSAMFMLACFSA